MFSLQVQPSDLNKGKFLVFAEPFPQDRYSWGGIIRKDYKMETIPDRSDDFLFDSVEEASMLMGNYLAKFCGLDIRLEDWPGENGEENDEC